MKRFTVNSKSPPPSSQAPAVGGPSSVGPKPTKARSVKPNAASTRMYGKADPAPTPAPSPSPFGFNGGM